jgi:uncharacterized membrane protein (UPF0127 family)
VAVVVLAGCAGLTPTTETTAPEPTTTDTTAPEPTTTTTPHLGGGSTPVATPGSNYDTTTVVLLDANGTELATVDAWVADTFAKRYTGLSDTESLESGQGMLFVFDGEGDRAFVMRDMAFPLDMVFVDAEGTITAIHHAPVDSDGDLTQYSGRAKYVLEVPMGYTNRTGVEVGDRMRIEDR